MAFTWNRLNRRFIESANFGDRSARVAIQPITVAYTHHDGQEN